MRKKRRLLYQELEKKIGKTPLYEILHVAIPNGNRIFFKEENENPGASLYDRIFLQLFRHYEARGRIIPGVTPVVEPTSGSAGISFEWVGKALGYECTVVSRDARDLGKIQSNNNARIESGKRPYFTLNYTQGEAALISAEAVEKVIDEAVEQGLNRYAIKFDLAVAAKGNGATILGFGAACKRNRIPLVVWEDIGSKVFLDYPFEELEYALSNTPGHAFYDPVPLTLITIEEMANPLLVEAAKEEASRPNERYPQQGLLASGTKRPDLRRMPTLEQSIELLKDEGKLAGRISAGNLAIALRKSQQLFGKNILTFFYDNIY